MISLFDESVADMMASFGTTAYIVVATSEQYDPETSQNVVSTTDYRVNAMFFDYLDKKQGLGTSGTSLIQSGDKQVFVQPPHKTETGLPLPHLLPNRDKLKLGDKVYKIITLKQYNPSMTDAGCVLYELFVRE
jgi:hypothetical protein